MSSYGKLGGLAGGIAGSALGPAGMAAGSVLGAGIGGIGDLAAQEEARKKAHAQAIQQLSQNFQGSLPGMKFGQAPQLPPKPDFGESVVAPMVEAGVQSAGKALTGPGGPLGPAGPATPSPNTTVDSADDEWRRKMAGGYLGGGR